MKRVTVPILAAVLMMALSSCATRKPAPTAAESPAAPWPLVFSDSAGVYTIYQPQCDSWNGHEFTGRSAVAVQAPGATSPTYGVVQFSAITLVNKSTHTVSLADIQIIGTDFPFGHGPADGDESTLQEVFSAHAPSLSLDDLENDLAVNQPKRTERLRNNPPKIIIADRPAVLVSIDGSPAWRPVPGTRLDRVINTRVLLLRDSSGEFYLHLFDGYLQAHSLAGPWTVATSSPPGAATAEQQAMNTGQVDLMEGAPDAATRAKPSLRAAVVPDIYVETEPSELITFSGPPAYVPITGTALLYADNTTGNVFKQLTDQQNYILISGRWYRASSLDGPWTFVPGDRLPRDFANIPDNSPKENVKASVAGTPQAAEALIANNIPQSQAIPRSNRMQPPVIDGAIQLAPIAGTPLHYVANSGTPIIEVDAHTWYACRNGVWYAATSANGPWIVAASVPAVIYTIPDDSPLHYVTYVQVYGASPDVVYEGYTPGYFGTVVAADGTVVYGTGYEYDPWIGAVWFGPPVTWGCGFDECWTPWWGWGFDCGFGWGCDFPGYGWWVCAPPFPWWCGYYDWDDFDDDDGYAWWDARRAEFANTSADFFHRREQYAISVRNRWQERYAAARRRARARMAELGRAYNSRTGQLAAGQRARVQNVYGSAWNPASGPGGRRNQGINPGYSGLMNDRGQTRYFYNSPSRGTYFQNRNSIRTFANPTAPFAAPRQGSVHRSFQNSGSPGWQGSKGDGGGWRRGGGGGSFEGGGRRDMR